MHQPKRSPGKRRRRKLVLTLVTLLVACKIYWDMILHQTLHQFNVLQSPRKSAKLSIPLQDFQIQPFLQQWEASIDHGKDIPSLYAYAFVIGTCDPNNNRYKGFLYNILVSTRILMEEGSTADVVAFFQMSYNSGANKLPDQEEQMLLDVGVTIKYIPPSQSESFYDTVMEKFRILTLKQYNRVILLDGDVMPVANADFLFKLSDGADAMLKDNVIVMGPYEPANGGLFMLTPGEGKYEQVLEIIRKREEDATRITNRNKFDTIKGWGHVFEEGDGWETRFEIPWRSYNETVGRKWDFHFAFSDQGLLYYYAKYICKSVSMLTGFGGTTVQNWGPSLDGRVEKERTFNIPFLDISTPRIHLKIQCKKFLCHFMHFTSNDKPWLKVPTSDMLYDENRNTNAHYLWWNTLNHLNAELNIGLDFVNWDAKSFYPPLGMYAKFEDLDRRVIERASLTSRVLSS